uniref:Secreted protein n=1 Tax=Paramormyrops kingsleyae TaxID=1676925 RepID=A0A3B3QFA6_9TELE
MSSVGGVSLFVCLVGETTGLWAETDPPTPKPTHTQCTAPTHASAQGQRFIFYFLYVPHACLLSSYPHCSGIEREQLQECKALDNVAIFCLPILILLHKWL